LTGPILSFASDMFDPHTWQDFHAAFARVRREL
jgi:hypothetical protein